MTVAPAADLVTYGSCEETTEVEDPWAPYVAEFVGTFILVFTFGCVTISTVPWKPTAVGCCVTVMLYATPQSGGCLNPAVSLGLSLQGAMPLWRWLGLCLTEFLAAFCAAGALEAVGGVQGQEPPYGSMLLLLELLYTAILCFVACCCRVLKRNNPKDTSQTLSIALGLLYVAGGHALRLFSAMNPVIAMSVAWITPGGWRSGVTWAVTEMLGALLGTYLFAVLRAGAEDYYTEEFLERTAPRRYVRLLAELTGTFTVVMTFGLCMISLSEATSWASAAALICMIYALGKISGGHFNPAVTLAVVLSGRSVCPVADGLMYAAVQVGGGLAAGLLVAVYHLHGPYTFISFTPLPLKPWNDYNVVTVGIAEGIFTFVLAYVALASTVRDAKVQSYFGVAEGFCLLLGGCAVGTVSGAMLNPAVAVGVWMLNTAGAGALQELGPSVWTLLKFATFQCTGGLLAAVVFRITRPSEYSKVEVPLLVR